MHPIMHVESSNDTQRRVRYLSRSLWRSSAVAVGTFADNPPVAAIIITTKNAASGIVVTSFCTPFVSNPAATTARHAN